MIEIFCPGCNKKLMELQAEGSYRISINCRRCKKIVELKSVKHGVEKIQHPFEDMIAQPS